MKIELPDTDTRNIAASLLEARENNSLTTGRAHARRGGGPRRQRRPHHLRHPRRLPRAPRLCWCCSPARRTPPASDAEVRRRPRRRLGDGHHAHHRRDGQPSRGGGHPLLLPDTPVVAWWPTTAPADPRHTPWAAWRNAASPTPITRRAARCWRACVPPTPRRLRHGVVEDHRLARHRRLSLDRHPQRTSRRSCSPAPPIAADRRRRRVARRPSRVPVSREVCDPGDDQRLFPIRSLFRPRLRPGHRRGARPPHGARQRAGSPRVPRRHE